MGAYNQTLPHCFRFAVEVPLQEVEEWIRRILEHSPPEKIAASFAVTMNAIRSGYCILWLSGFAYGKVNFDPTFVTHFKPVETNYYE